MKRVVDIVDLRVDFATDAGSVKAVDGVDLTVDAGEVLAIVGESGSGKTVTAKAIIGLLPDSATTRGAIVLNGRDVVGLTGAALRATRGADAAMVFQEPSTALNPVFTVGWQIAEGLRAHGANNRAQARAKAIEMLRSVGIPEPEKRVDLPAPVLGRPAAARDDRDGAGARAGAHHRRRADHGARRDHPGGRSSSC